MTPPEMDSTAPPAAKREGVVWKILRLLLGPPVMALVYTQWFSWPYGLLNESEVRRYTAVAFIGGLLFTTGLLGLIRVIAGRRKTASPRSWGSKIGWLAAAGLLAALLAGAEAYAGRKENVRSVERSRFKEASAKNTAEAWSSWRYFLAHSHASLMRFPDDDAQRERVEKIWGTRQILDDDNNALNTLKNRLEQTHGGAAEWEDCTWWLDRFTPVRDHARAAELAYEEARFRESAAAGTPAELRCYRLEFPRGRHLDEAKALLQARYLEAEKRYEEIAASKKANPESAAGIRALLAWLRENDVDARVVPVSFLPVEGLDAAKLEDVVRQVTGAKLVVPVSPSFTAEMNAKRQSSVTISMDQALRAVAASLVVLRETKVEESRRQARFLVGYQVFPTGTVYKEASQNDLPPSERTVYVGIGLRFDCTIQVPTDAVPLEEDLTRGHTFSLKAVPALHFTAQSEKAGLSAASVYGAMVSTAFDDFRDALIRSYGLDVAKR